MRLFPVSVILLLAWGALAVGGAPSWAAAPVAVFAATTGILGFLERRESAPTLPHRPVILALCLFLAAIGVQLVPLPEAIVTRLSPSHDVTEFERLLATADRRDPESVPKVENGASRPLSIARTRTWFGLGVAAAFALYLIGASRGLSAVGVRGLMPWVAVLGAVVALLGMYQKASGTAVVYGLYFPLDPGVRSAPFINSNHQAGWLVMVLSLVLGTFAGEVARGIHMVAPRWRDRIIWSFSNEASGTVLLLFAALVIAIGVLTTQSRSGAGILLLALATLALWKGRRQRFKVSRPVIAIGVASVAAIAFFTSGSAVMSRLTGMSSISGEARLAVWQDSWQILRDFWITGTGFNTYGAAMLHYQTVADGYRYIEAHNDYLQLAIEGGLLVGLPALILIASLVSEIRRRFHESADDTRTYWIRVGAVAGVFAIAAQSTVEFTLQISGAAVMFATLLAIAIHHPPARMASRERHAE